MGNKLFSDRVLKRTLFWYRRDLGVIQADFRAPPPLSVGAVPPSAIPAAGAKAAVPPAALVALMALLAGHVKRTPALSG